MKTNSCPNCKKLREEIHLLEERLKMLEYKPVLRAGFTGENIISKITGGQPTAFCSPHDLKTKHDGKLLEIKYANLISPNKNSKTKRWCWGHALGVAGNKQYDRLILVGVTDPNVDYGALYDAPYIFFDVPYQVVPDFMYKKNGLIQISTNPHTIRQVQAKLMYDKYWVTLEDLEKRYGI